MDGAAAARHVGPPRTLDVQQFAAARSSEIQALYNALKAQQEAKNSSGVGAQLSSSFTTPRHLRRRTASHNRRIPFRWKHNATQSGKTKKAQEANSSSPRLQSNVASTSVERETSSSSKRKKPEKRLPSRRVRRRIELQGVREGTISCMRDGTRRLATHVWHAKRFPMTNTWGYRLPQGLPGRGRGSKAVFKWLKEAAVLHDASYMGVIELEGTEDGILRILGQVLETLSGRPWIVEEQEMHGLLYGNAVIHNAGKVPREAIAPVSILWRPSSSEGRDTSAHLTGGDCRGEERQLWIWVHPSAFDDAFSALSTVCEGQGLEDLQASVKCRSRRGELARLDILGSRALQVLQKVLRPVRRNVAHRSSTEIAGLSGHEDGNQNTSCNTSPDDTQSLRSKIFAKADCLPAGAVMALDVYDPRDTPRSFYSVANSSVSGPAQACFTDSNLSDNTMLTGDHSMEEETAARHKNTDHVIREDTAEIHWESLLEKGLSKEVSDSPHLWSPQTEGMRAALSQKAFSKKRQKSRKRSFTDIERDLEHSSLESSALDSRDEQGGVCPILLLKQTHLKPSVPGWSIILPITWVQAFWVPLVFSGGHVIGLRERHWLATDAGIPYFPHDYPDCPAHAHHLEVASASFKRKNQARPPSKRSPPFSVSPVQWSVLNAYNDRLLDGSGRNAVVSSGLIDTEHGEQLMEERDTTPGGTVSVKQLDGDTAMIEAGTTASRTPSLLVNHSDRDAKMAGRSDTVVSSPVSRADFETVHDVGFHEPHAALPDESAQKEERSPNEVSPLPLAPHDANESSLQEFGKLEGATAMPGFVIGAPVSVPACQAVEAPDNTDTANLEGDVAMTETTEVTGSPVSSTSCQVGREYPKEEGDIAITETSGLVTNSLLSPAPTSKAVEVFSVQQALGDNAVTEADPLPNVVTSSSIQSTAAVHELVCLDGRFATAETDVNVALRPCSAITVQGQGERQLKMPLGEDGTDMGDVPTDPVLSPRVTSERQQPAMETHDSDQHNCGVLTSLEKALAAEEVVASPAMKLPHFEVSDRVRALTNLSGREQSCTDATSNPGDHPSQLTNSIKKTIAERSRIPMFVARTADALTQVFKENNMQHALLLCDGSMKYRGAQDGLKHGTLEWRASQKSEESADCTGANKIHAMVGDHVKGCYVRVLIMIPRKGVMKENGVLCSSTKEDFDSFLNRSKQWQGVDTSWMFSEAKEPKKKKGKRKGKEKKKGREKGKTKGEAPNPSPGQPNLEAEDFSKDTPRLDVGCAECCNRETIGCITSTGPQGSTWSATGICEASSLMKLRAMQWQDERWRTKKEILLLAGSTLSPILRPVLVSIVVESGPQEDVIW